MKDYQTILNFAIITTYAFIIIISQLSTKYLTSRFARISYLAPPPHISHYPFSIIYIYSLHKNLIRVINLLLSASLYVSNTGVRAP